ncbi:hypothetical protein [Kitasatospora sp. NPDC057198]|uniref:hypothetical protein n=1 Tax=Kitasatospora sp. NPDC057198 TaxID=3346046 RepID=UPI003641A809
MSAWHPPAPPGLHTGPLRKRGIVGLWLQFCLQWFWLPVWFFLNEGELGAVLTPSRYRLERRGTREDWEASLGKTLDKVIPEAQRLVRVRQEANESGKYPFAFVGPLLVPTITLSRSSYRGIGLEGLAAVAARRGWQVRWETARFQYVGLFQAEAQPQQPQPQGYQQPQHQQPQGYQQPHSYQQQYPQSYQQQPNPYQQ